MQAASQIQQLHIHFPIVTIETDMISVYLLFLCTRVFFFPLPKSLIQLSRDSKHFSSLALSRNWGSEGEVCGCVSAGCYTRVGNCGFRRREGVLSWWVLIAERKESVVVMGEYLASRAGRASLCFDFF